MKFVSRSESETKKIAKNLAKMLHGGEIITLRGDLGAGKTTFVKGLARGFSITEAVQSPTFVLMRILRVPHQDIKKTAIKKIVHIDVYRLKNEVELAEIGALDYFGKPDTVVVLEWPEHVKNLFSNFKKIIPVRFSYGKKESERVVTLPDTYGVIVRARMNPNAKKV